MQTLWDDLRYGVRILARNPGSAAMAILTLALGIGATTLMFSVVYSVFFQPLPYKNFQRSVIFRITNLANTGGWKGRVFSTSEYAAFREQNHTLEDIAGHAEVRVFYEDSKSTRRLANGSVVTANTFDYLGVPALLGRTISSEDGKPGAPRVFVMNYRVWRAEFGGDTGIVGTSFVLNGKPHVLVGIMPPRFNAFSASVWMPVRPDEEGGGMLSVMGRLRPGVKVEAATADLNAIAHHLQEMNPDPYPEKFAVEAQTLVDSSVGRLREPVYALLATVLLLLLIACSNVANLRLAHAIAREKEMAIRASMGATRARLVRQLLVETSALAIAASVVGCALAYLGLSVVVSLIPAGAIPEESTIRLNAPVLMFSLGIALVTALLCGLAPALHVFRRDLRARLASSGQGIGGTLRHGKLRQASVVIEVALSIVLLVGAGLLLRSFFVLTRVDLGFNPQNVLYFRLALPQSYDESREKQNALTRRLLDRMGELPSVRSVAESMLLPPLSYDWSETIIPGKPHVERWETRFEICSEGYFRILGLRLLRGRVFSEEDVETARYVSVVNETFARQYLSNEDPIGKKFKLEVLDRTFLNAPHNTYFEIVGVVTDYKTRGEDAWENVPQAFIPYSVQGFSWRTYTARTASDPKLLLKTIGQEVRTIDPNVGIAVSGTIAGTLKEFYSGPKFELVILGTFAGIGLTLVLAGVFSVMAYAVSLQTREIGVRMALGAQQSTILGMVLRTGFRLVALGIAIGLGASLWLTRFLGSQISGVSTTDPWTFGAVAAVIAAVGLAACFVPARRAMRIDPIVALRYE